MSSGKKLLLPQEPELTYLKDKTMAEMRPVTKTTIPSTQKRPLHLVKSTFEEKNLVFNGWDSMNAQQPRQNTTHLCLEAENCDADADDCRDAQRQKHHFCLVVTKKKKKQKKSYVLRNTELLFICGLCESLLTWQRCLSCRT